MGRCRSVLAVTTFFFAFLYGACGLHSSVAHGRRTVSFLRLSAEAPPPVEINTNISMGLAQLRPFLQIAVPFFKEDEKARNSLIGVAALTLLNSGVSVAFSYVGRDFYNALNSKDQVLFSEKVQLFFAALLIAVPITVYYRYLREKLSLYWREALTAKVLENYYTNNTFFILETLRDLDNPDQRISEDIRRFTQTSLDFFITLFTSLIDLLSFSAILFSIYPGLFAAIVVYAGAGSLITTNLGRSLVSLNYQRLTREADFRFSLIRTRENAESIAFYDSNAGLERSYLMKSFAQALDTQLGIITAQRNLEYFTTSYRYLVQILPSLIVAPLYFSGKVELGSVTQSFGAFNHILSDFSIIINQFEALSAFSAGLDRLSTFLERLNTTAVNRWDTPSYPGKTLITMQRGENSSIISPPALLSCRNLTVLTPDASRVLIGGIEDEEGGVTGINIDINQGGRVLIVGPSGSGKSSFVRAIAGLWEVGSGSVAWSSDASAFFLPQRPYNVLGTLREQIMYPNIQGSSAGEDESFREIMRKVRLGDLIERMGGLDATKDWSKTLSLGEQQRLAFARVLYNKPSVVFLDESTSALDLNSEEALYTLLKELGVTFVSVGHRPSLLRHHTSKITLLGNGKSPLVSDIDPTSSTLI